jgi:MOSC domain-containing protein YiiM
MQKEWLMPESIGSVVSIALRTSEGGPMREVREVVATAGGGLAGDVAAHTDRGITLIDLKQWNDVRRDLNAPGLPWHTRRANVLVDGLRMADLIGRTIRIGPVEVQVNAETKPCGMMDDLHAGLRAALQPDCRGGVCGRIVRGGTISVDDQVLLAT